MMKKTKIACNCSGALALLLLGGLVLAPAPAAAQSSGNLCIKEKV